MSECPRRAKRRELPITSHKQMVLSADAEASRMPFGLYATELTRLACPESVAIDAPVSTSQIYMQLFSDAQATCEPSGEKVTKTQGKGVRNVCSRTPVPVYHTS